MTLELKAPAASIKRTLNLPQGKAGNTIKNISAVINS
jgi:hypothetical protein